jgi:hemerythrin-like domain-containing protein
MMQKKIDLLTRPHKEQRKWMYLLGTQAGELDFNNTTQAEQFEIEFKALMDDLKDHSENEELFILPLLTKRFPQEAHIFQHDHPELKAKIQTLLKRIEELNQSTVVDKTDLALSFYRLFNQFIGEYLLHLDSEERNILPVLEKHYSAEELLGVMITFKTFREGNKPDQLIQFIKSFIEPLNQNAVCALFLSIKNHTSVELFQQVCHVARQAIEPTLWLQVEKQL